MQILEKGTWSGRLGGLLLACLLVLSGCDSAEKRAQSHYENGLKLVEQGEIVKAGLEFRNALSLRDDFVPALFELAKVEKRQGRFDRAVQFLANVTERAPDHVEARVELGNILLLAGQLDQALKYADEAYKLAPDNPDVLVLKAAVSLKLDNRGDAVRFAKAALEIAPNNVNGTIVLAAERMLAADPEGALVFLDKSSEQHDRDLGLQMFRMRALEALKDTKGVEEIFVRLAGYYPDNAAIWYGLARWYLAQGRKDDAEKTVRQFAAGNPDNDQAGLNVVAFLRQQKGLDAARAELAARISKGGKTFPYEMAMGELLFAEGKPADAIDLMKTVIAREADSADGVNAKIQLARMLMSRNETADASALVESILTKDSKNVNALTVRAAIKVAAKNYDAASEDLRTALNEAPESSRLLQLLAEVYERNGSVELAEEQLVKAARAEQFKPEVAMALVQFLLRYGKAEQAERVLTEIRNVAPADKQVLTLLARLKLARQDWVGAEEIAAALRKADNAGTSADQVLAAALGGQKKYDESIRVLQSAVSDTSAQSSGMAALAAAYVRANKPEAAEAFVRSVLAENPDNVQAHVILGSLQAAMKRMEDAEKSLKLAAEKDGRGTVGHRALAEFYIRTNRVEDAEETIRDALGQVNNNSSLRLLLAIVLERRGDFEAAIAEYQSMFEAEPRSTVVANNLASLLAEYRDDKESLDTALEIASRFRTSDIPQFVDTLGWAHYRKGDYEQAVTLLKSAAEKLPDVKAVQYHLGMAYKQIGRKELAIESLKKAIENSDAESFPQRDSAVAALMELDPAARGTN